jgi:20S proteasome alpha/beta subunit
MSLAIAVEAKDGVVLLSDSRTTAIIDGMNYQIDEEPKIGFINGYPVAMVGSVEILNELIKRVHEELKPFTGSAAFSKDCDEIADLMRTAFEKKYGDLATRVKCVMPSTGVTFVGHGEYGDESGAFIYQIQVRSFFGPTSKWRFALAGQSFHGAAHYLAKFHSRSMNVKEAAFLAYFCIKEVSTLDATVGVPIRIWTVQNRTSREMTKEWGDEFCDRHGSAAELMKGWF